MKHILLGTSALVAAGLLAAPANAAEKIKLGLGGFYNASMGANFSGDDDDLDAPADTSSESGAYHNNFDIHQNIEIHFKGETTLDNGITVGARVELEGDDDAERIDESWAYFSGGFGEIRFGSDDAAPLQTCVGEAGSVTANFGVSSPNEAFNNVGDNGLAGVGSFGSCYGTAGDGLKILYYTPQFGPFNFVVSFAPEANADDKGPTTSTSFDGGPGGGDDQEDEIGVGMNFTHEGNGFSLLGSLGASWITDDTSDDDKTSFYQAGLQVGFGAWTIGVGGEILNNYDDAFGSSTPTGVTVATDSDLWALQIGGNYAWDAWTIGLGWTHAQAEITSSSDEDTVDYISLNGSYALGPGIALEGNIAYSNYDEDNNDANADYDAFEVGFGTAISF
jgi:predicted porin